MLLSLIPGQRLRIWRKPFTLMFKTVICPACQQSLHI